MSRAGLAITAFLSLFAASAHATVIEIPLPSLLGSYPETADSRTVTFQLPAPPTVIHGVSIRIGATHVVGSIVCEWGGPYEWPMTLSASMQDAPHGWWIASQNTPIVSGPFTSTEAFTTSFPATTWAFLMDGEGELIFYGTPAGLVGLCFEDPIPPTAEVTEAVLIVDAEFPLSIETSTWGKIKALYRN